MKCTRKMDWRWKFAVTWTRIVVSHDDKKEIRNWNQQSIQLHTQKEHLTLISLLINLADCCYFPTITRIVFVSFLRGENIDSLSTSEISLNFVCNGKSIKLQSEDLEYLSDKNYWNWNWQEKNRIQKNCSHENSCKRINLFKYSSSNKQNASHAW